MAQQLRKSRRKFFSFFSLFFFFAAGQSMERAAEPSRYFRLLQFLVFLEQRGSPARWRVRMRALLRAWFNAVPFKFEVTANCLKVFPDYQLIEKLNSTLDQMER